jgi:hypothetical protein
LMGIIPFSKTPMTVRALKTEIDRIVDGLPPGEDKEVCCPHDHRWLVLTDVLPFEFKTGNPGLSGIQLILVPDGECERVPGGLASHPGASTDGEG